MEYALPELLTREQILIILDGRGIKLPDIESLPLESLLPIYKAFVVPLAKRETAPSRRNNTNGSTPVNTPVQLPQQSDIDVEMKTDMPREYPGEEQVKRLKRFGNATKICLKRPLGKGELNPQTDDQYLSTATKRIKITWP